MGFTVIDYIIVLVYLVGVALFGVLTGGKQTSTKDYFLGGRKIPWLVVSFAVVATETSAITFISIPGLAYLTNLNFLQIALGYILGRIIIAILFLPPYYRGELVTAYELLRTRFGEKTRNYASVVFLITRTLATGVRLFTTAIPLAIIFQGYKIFSGYPVVYVYAIAIIIITIFTFIYTYTGGIKAVIWTDVVQMFIYIGGASIALYIMLTRIPGGWGTVMSMALAKDKLEFIHWGFSGGLAHFFTINYTFIASVLGGAFLSMASHGTDQLIVQRLLATDSVRSSQKAVIASGFFVALQFLFFLVIGIVLYAFYHAYPFKDGDQIFPKFIVEQLPTGVSGIIVAGLFASAMGSLSGSINSLASSTLVDLYKPYFSKHEDDDAKDLRLSKLFSLIWTLILVGTAFIFIHSNQAVIVVALSIASVTYGGLLGTFLLGVLFKKPQQKDAIIGFTAGLMILIYIFFFTPIAWTWYTMIGSLTTIVVGLISARLTQGKTERVAS
ncbi:MAG: sodium:solute symporter [Bacteroidetes bacterium]|nr:sodium:solute symporter [Bacteroidota bacterium]MCL5034618.1 sodium:solute symporter [Bacteroidota bacterium]